ncbi:ABC transporter permease [Leucobacter sp. OH2974_COT-288]|uniref:Ribose transport system permease protein n=1 Tax=Canibacter oris TaxID=1365628 RepID=A0A840DF29_9MICO|nr:ABC transporter permease [Canibacter oris]MBB4072021.1 ribose transport system permease protein [Canibacter oris]RRD35632.1 ABC transporter permease [Leucobacter sp. OH2974_COT-288]
MSTAQAGSKLQWRSWLQQGLAVATLVVLFGFFTIMNPSFGNWSNVSGILLAAAGIAIMAIGTTFVIATGGIDLSIGTGSTLVAVVFGVFAVKIGIDPVLSLLLAIAAGALMGFINGFCIAYLGLPPFIATLAMMMVAQGLALILSGVAPIYFTDIPWVRDIALGEVIPSLPNAVLLMFIIAIISWFALSKSRFGRIDLAIGSNEEATRLSGIDTKKWLLMIYVVAGIFTAIAGIVLASRLSSAQPQTGVGLELQAIAAVIIGGTSLMGGRASIVGTVIGALIMAVLLNGLRIMGVQSEWQFVVSGLVIALAVWFDTIRNRSKS